MSALPQQPQTPAGGPATAHQCHLAGGPAGKPGRDQPATEPGTGRPPADRGPVAGSEDRPTSGVVLGPTVANLLH